MRTHTTLARTIAVVLVALGAAACSDAAAPVAPVVPSAPSLAKGGPNTLPTNGRIYFSSALTGGSSEIYSMNADGSDRKRLTYSNDEYDQYLAVSRDGKKLVVTAQPEGVFESRLYTMNTDGSNHRFVTSLSGGIITDPVWSPDGRTIAYVARPGGSDSEIWTVSTSGGKATRLTPAGQLSGWPSYSPDGSRIVYAAKPEGGDKWNLYIMNADGSNPQLLLACDFNCATPVWTPDGGQVVYTVIDAITAHVRTCLLVQPMPICGVSTGIDLTSSRTFDLSPDGSQIAYMSSVSDTDRIGTANLNGSAQTFVTPDLKPIFDVAWGR